jgi:hypothetical protein
METTERNRERSFSIELKSITHLKSMAMTSATTQGVLIEGVLGELQQAHFAEGIILEVVGSCGILRVDLGEGEIKTAKLNGEGGEFEQ